MIGPRRTLLFLLASTASLTPSLFAQDAEASFREGVELLDLQATLERISQLPQATIAKIEGFARGGGHEFALACDMRIAKDGPYRFGLPEISVGILPGAGGTQRLTEIVGRGRALEMMLRARLRGGGPQPF